VSTNFIGHFSSSSIDKNFLFVGRSILSAVLCVKNILPQDVGCCMDDPAEGIWQHLFYREISEPLGLFSRQECQFIRNSDKPLQHALFFKCVMTVCNHPKSIPGRRRRRFAYEEDERDNQKGCIRCTAGHGFWACLPSGHRQTAVLI
jgi:hypothetical protein